MALRTNAINISVENISLRKIATGKVQGVSEEIQVGAHVCIGSLGLRTYASKNAQTSTQDTRSAHSRRAKNNAYLISGCLAES